MFLHAAHTCKIVWDTDTAWISSKCRENTNRSSCTTIITQSTLTCMIGYRPSAPTRMSVFGVVLWDKRERNILNITSTSLSNDDIHFMTSRINEASRKGVIDHGGWCDPIARWLLFFIYLLTDLVTFLSLSLSFCYNCGLTLTVGSPWHRDMWC